MTRWKLHAVAGAAVVAVSLAVFMSPASGVAGRHAARHPATGVGSCTLKGWDPNDPNEASRPIGDRHQFYKPDNYNCTGAHFSKPGVEFARFPQPKDFHVPAGKTIPKTLPLAPKCQAGECSRKAAQMSQQAAAINPLAPYFPPFTHFVIIMRENHTFDDYLGDCATSIAAGCNGQVEGTNHISSVPDLHSLASTYALGDAYSTGTEPPSGPNHWWLFTGQSSSSSQQQSYPTATGSQFDRFLGSDTGPSGEGTSACTTQTGTGTGTSPYTMILNGDFYWMLNSGSGWWRNPGTKNVEALPVDRPGTTVPEELHYNEYTCSGQNIPDQTVGTDFLNFVTTDGLPAYSYVELFNDHPGSFQDIPTNDSTTNQIVNSIMSNTTYKNNTVIVVTEDDTQNGNNGPDHVSNTFRVPLVVIGSPTYVKQHYLSHVAYTTSNVIAAMERTMQNVHSGIISPTDSLSLSTFPMTSADQAALGDPLEDFWVQGSTPLSATASGTPTTGNAPLSVSFAGTATGGTAPYTYSWNFGDGSATSSAQNPSHTYTAAGTYTATLTVTDSSSPAKTATSTVSVNVNAVGNPLQATASAVPTSGQIPLSVAFTGTATGGNPTYSYSWNFGDGSATSAAQNPSHTYTAAGTYTATLTVTDSSSPAKTATSTVSVNVNAVGNPLQATASAVPTSGQIPLSVAFTGTATGGNPTYSYSWNFGDGSATSAAQNPSHTYTAAGTYTATLTVTDSSSPAKTATSSVTVTASPVQGTTPGPPQNVTAGAGNGQVSLSWQAPASNGGVNITSYKVYRGTSPGSETLLTSGGCSGLGAVLSCTDTGLTNGQAYYYKVSAVNALGEGSQSSEASATPTGGCAAAQLLGNPGFETGTAAPWSATTGVIADKSQEPPHTGTWDAWLDGYGTTHTDTLSQSVTLPSGCSTYKFSFWLHVDTAETTQTTAYDKLNVQVLNSSGAVLTTLHTYSNLDHNTGYAQHSFSLSNYAGQKITLKFTGTEDFELQTSFVLDDTALNVS